VFFGAAIALNLAYQAFRSSGTRLDLQATEKTQESVWRAFKQGILIDVLNPKVAIFFMAFLPQFLREGHGSTSWHLLYLGGLVILVAIVVETLIVFLASGIADKFQTDKRYSIWLDRVVRTVFVGLGVKLATSSNSVPGIEGYF
jgi:threonine/homoserine/homoserine lactone efflux protein